MDDAVSSTIEVRVGTDDLPGEAGGLLGGDARDRFDADDENTLAVGIVDRGVWVAALLMHVDRVEDEIVGSIRQLVIPPPQRGRGIAGRLIRRAMAIAGERGAARLRTTAGWGCPDHAALYRRMRFDPASADDTPYLFTRDL